MPCKKVLSLVLASVALGACTGNKSGISRGDGFAFFKNPDSNQACLSSNLSQWELSGAFLHRMLACASNRSSDGGETLPATQDLLADLSAEKMQKLVDFALLPDANATTHEERYPYLLALASVLDRGITQGQKQGLNLTTERLGDLQPFLLSLDPERVQQQMRLWSASGRLENLLAELGIFVQALENDSISAMTREVLEGQNFGPRFLRVSSAVLKQDALMHSLDQALGATPMQAPDAASRAQLLSNWRQPLSPDAPDHAPAAQLEGGSTTFAQHLDEFSKTLTDDEIKKLSGFLISFWNSYRSLGSEERLSISRRLSSSLEQGLDQQKNAVQWFLAVAQDLSTMPASDLNSISETLDRLLEPSNDPTLDTLRSKLWSSRMMEQMLAFISQGGAVPGCGSMTIPALKDLPADDFAPTYEVLRSLNMPQAACGGLIPLKAALENWSNVAVGRTCEDANCLELNEKTLDPAATASYWADAYAEPEAALVKNLLRVTLLESRELLQQDSYYWRNIGVASRAASPAVVDRILELWEQSAPRSLKDLARWESGLESDPALRGILAPDPIEKLLGMKIERLSSISQQFHDLVPAGSREVDKATNQRASRIFAGAYTEGPIEQALRSKLSPAILNDASLNWPQDIKQTFATNPSLFSHFLQRFKNADSILRNPELGSLVDGSDIPLASLGSPARYVAFNDQREVTIQPRADNRLIQPLQSIQPAGDGNNAAWGLWQQQLASSTLVGKDMPPEQAGAFQDFSAQLVSTLSADERWTELTSSVEPDWNRSAGIDPQFYDVQPYAAAEARILALYYLRHYHKLPNAFPLKAELPTLPTGTYRGFFSGASLVSSMDADFSLFVKFFPDQLGAAAPSLETLASQALLPDTNGVFFPVTKVTQVTRVGLLNGKFPALLGHANFKLMSTLNLLGLNKSGSSYYVQPLVGLEGKTCVGTDGKTALCAVELKAAADYQAYVSAVVAQNFCPLLAQDQFGPRAVWSQRLQLSLSAQDTCAGGRLLAANVGDEVRFPVWMSRRVLNDIFHMGRQASLKKGLAQIPAALRFYKIAQQNLNANERTGLFLRQARGHWSALNAASQSRRQYYAVQFWAAQPNLLNAYIDQWEQSIETISWTDFLARLARRGQGASQDVVHEFFSLVIETQKESAAAGQSLLEMGFTLMERISARPDLLDAAGHVLGNFASAENYDFAGRDLPYAMTLFTSFSWNDPGPRFSKFLAQKESIKTWVLLCEYFSPDEFGRFLNQLQKSSVELGAKSERSALLVRFLKENVSLGTLAALDSKESLSTRWNQILLAWQQANFGSGFLQQWESLLSTLDKPLTTLDGRASFSAATILERWLPPILRQGVSLLHVHQETGVVEEDGFWSRMALNLVQSVDSQPIGARAMSRFLADPRLGFGTSQLWIRALNESVARHSLAEALTSFSSISEHLWREALVESSTLLGRLSKALGYMKQRMVWKEDPEHNAYRQVIDQLYALSSDGDLRDRQIEVLQLWFKDEDER